MGGEFHFYLECVAFEAYGVEVERFKHAAPVAHESSGGVVHGQACDDAHVFGGVVRHEHAPHGPVHDVDSREVSRAYGHVGAFFGAGTAQALEVGGIVAEVGVHFEHVTVAFGKRAAEAFYVGRAQAELACALREQHAPWVFGHFGLYDVGGPVGRIIVDYERVEAVFQGKDRVYDCGCVFALVVHRDYHHAVAAFGSVAHHLYRVM